mmetsp:Transcript_18653/g.45897  ORF Transcript_18653/g.45897 Transcript_18653/m.45897 type:complete len:479 (+) Transcript_18653:3-1439(+)
MPRSSSEWGPYDPNCEVALVVGAGPAGLLCARVLASRGYMVNVFEKTPDPEEKAPRSWPLLLGERALIALENEGIDLVASGKGVPVKGFAMMGSKGAKRVMAYSGKRDKVVVDRSELMDAIRSAKLVSAEAAPLSVHYNSKYVGIDANENFIKFEGDALPYKGTPWSLLVAADGERSAVRADLEEKQDFLWAHEGISRDFCQVSVPANVAPELPRDQVVVFASGGGVQLILAPTPDGSFRGVLVLPTKGGSSFAALKGMDKRQGDAFVDRRMPGARAVLDAAYGGDFHGFVSEAAVFNGGISTICKRMHSERGRVMLLGDAAHSMSSSLGQGCNAALEDVTVLDQILCTGLVAKYIPREFSSRRLPDASAIVALSMNAFPTTVPGFTLFVMQSFALQLFHKYIPNFPLPTRSYVQTLAPYRKVWNRRKWENRLFEAILLATVAGPLGVAVLRKSPKVSGILFAAVGAGFARLLAQPTK